MRHRVQCGLKVPAHSVHPDFAVSRNSMVKSIRYKSSKGAIARELLRRKQRVPRARDVLEHSQPTALNTDVFIFTSQDTACS